MMSFGDVASYKSNSTMQLYSHTTSKLMTSLNCIGGCRINANSPRNGFSPNLEGAWIKKKRIECSSMVSIAVLCPRDPGSNPGRSAAKSSK